MTAEVMIYSLLPVPVRRPSHPLPWKQLQASTCCSHSIGEGTMPLQESCLHSLTGANRNKQGKLTKPVLLVVSPVRQI